MAARRRARAAATFAHAVGEASAPGSPSLWRRLRAVPRLVRAVRSGEYTGVSSARLMLLLAGVGYVVSPIDVVPEGLLLVAQSNAGLPALDGDRFVYTVGPDAMGEHALELRELGIDIIGACCGSSPDHVRTMSAALAAR